MHSSFPSHICSLFDIYSLKIFPFTSWKTLKSKMSAARVVVSRELGVAGSYTMEASMAGQSHSQCHFGASDYLAQGRVLMEAVALLAEADDETLLHEMVSVIQN